MQLFDRFAHRWIAYELLLFPVDRRADAEMRDGHSPCVSGSLRIATIWW